MAKALDQMTQEELSEALEELDSVISADQSVVAGAKKRLNLHYRLRENILDILASGAMRRGWKH